MLITSRHNQQIMRLRSLLLRKHRDQTRLFLVEGAQLVTEAAQMGAEIETLVVSPGLLSALGRRAAAAAEERRPAHRIQVTPEVMASISPRHGADGVVAVARQRWLRLDDLDPAIAPSWVAVNRIGQPWSIGTIIRICAAVGGGGVILIGDSTDPYDPVAVRASLGTIFSQRLVKAGLQELAAWKQRHGCRVIGTSPAAAADYQEIAYQPPVVVFMGSERIGLSPDQQAICDAMVSLPMPGRCESHHVAVATGIVLYEALSQWRKDVRKAG
jgi:TrmH family RNA methyltransferase